MEKKERLSFVELTHLTVDIPPSGQLQANDAMSLNSESGGDVQSQRLSRDRPAQRTARCGPINKALSGS